APTSPPTTTTASSSRSTRSPTRRCQTGCSPSTALIAVGTHPAVSLFHRRGTESRLTWSEPTACADASDDAGFAAARLRGWCVGLLATDRGSVRATGPSHY